MKRTLFSMVPIQLLICFLVFGAQTLIAQGIELRFDSVDPQKAELVQTTTIQIKNTNLKMLVSMDEGPTTIIFRGDKQLVWLINDHKKQYMEITKQSIEQMSLAAQSMMSLMDQNITQLPKEQQEMIKNMVGSNPNQAKAESFVYKKTPETAKITHYTCVKYEVLKSGIKQQDLWVTEWKNVNERTELLSAFQAVGNFCTTLTQSFVHNPFVRSLDNPYLGIGTMESLPVKIIEFTNNTPALETVLKSIQRTKLSDDLFTPPKGYTVNTLGMPGSTK